MRTPSRLDALAAFFISAGLQEDEHVAIWSFNRPEFIITSTATMLARACTAPLYQTLSAAEAAYVLGHSDAPIAVVENEELLAEVLEVRDRSPGAALRGAHGGRTLPTATEAFVVPGRRRCSGARDALAQVAG